MAILTCFPAPPNNLARILNPDYSAHIMDLKMDLLRKWVHTLIWTTLSLSAGCVPINRGGELDIKGVYPLAPDFEAYWAAHGGLSTFGPPITAPVKDGPVLRQMCMNLALVYDPRRGIFDRVYLANLGWSLGLAQSPVPPPTDGSGRYFEETGHTLFPEFSEHYDALGGVEFLGAPITEMLFVEGRSQQIFQNGGLYLDRAGSSNAARLIALGLAAEEEVDPRAITGFSYVLPHPVVARPFGPFIDPHGGELLFGPPLSGPVLLANGEVEQIYTNAVVYVTAESNPRTLLRPLGALVGPADPPTPKTDEADGLYFQQSGHNVVSVFADFYRDHGVLLGLPLEEAHVDAGTVQQRFENAILELHPELPAHLAVQLAPLGKQYLLNHPLTGFTLADEHAADVDTSVGVEALGIQPITTGVTQTGLGGNTTWRLWIEVRSTTGKPLPGIAPLVILKYGDEIESPSPPETDWSGRTSIRLPHEKLAPGEIMTYEVAIVDGATISYASGEWIPPVSE